MPDKATITVPDGLSRGDSFTPAFTAPTNYQQRGATYLYAETLCWQDGVGLVLDVYTDLEGHHPANAGPIVLDSDYWQTGPAHGSIRMFALDFASGKQHNYASDTFEVAG